MFQRHLILPAFALALTALLGASAPAQAGCGCDHPPPAWAPVMPPFASPGKTIRIHPDSYELEQGVSWEVHFGSGWVPAVDAGGMLEVAVPVGTQPGPVSLRVRGGDVDVSLDEAHFTALARAPIIPAGTGTFTVPEFQASVTADGTLLVPFNLGEVLDPSQFAFQFGRLRLAFGQDEVVFYNEDGVDLTLFTLDVADPNQREWGSYYGWQVEQDTGIEGTVYENKILRSFWLRWRSDLLTYWRHEFHRYAAAHEPSGSHEVDGAGFHKQLGTRHIDHDHLVLAISGRQRSFWNPLDASRMTALEPGKVTVNVYVATQVSDNPVEPELMEAPLYGASSAQTQQMQLERPSAYDDDDDVDHDDDDD